MIPTPGCDRSPTPNGSSIRSSVSNCSMPRSQPKPTSRPRARSRPSPARCFLRIRDGMAPEPAAGWHAPESPLAARAPVVWIRHGNPIQNDFSPPIQVHRVYQRSPNWSVPVSNPYFGSPRPATANEASPQTDEACDLTSILLIFFTFRGLQPNCDHKTRSRILGSVVNAQYDSSGQERSASLFLSISSKSICAPSPGSL